MAVRRLICWVALVVLATASAASAQPRQVSSGPRNPGIWRQGRFLGFVPAHEKQAAEFVVPQAGVSVLESGEFIEGDVAAEDTFIPADNVGAPASAPCDACSAPRCGRPCCFEPCWWGRAEYLLWWTPGMDVPALATTGSAADPFPAVIGQPNTITLFGSTALNDNSRSGGRFKLGRWFDRWHSQGVEVGYLLLGQENAGFAASNNNFAVLGRPFFNAATGTADARLVANPGAVSGSLNISASTEFQAFEVLYRQTQAEACFGRIDFVVGYRFAELDDRLRFDESTLALAGPLAGTRFDLFDQFDTRSHFHGAQFGAIWQIRANPRWSTETVAKVAIGGVEHRADVLGQTTTTDAMGNTTVAPGGLLAQATNSGSYRWNDFATVSEFGITLRRELPRGMAATFGYSFLYWSNVIRAGDQIDTVVNPTQIPPGMLVGAARPAFPFLQNDFWAQGLRFGLDWNY